MFYCAHLVMHPHREESLIEAFVEQNDGEPARKAVFGEPLLPVQHRSILLVEEQESFDTEIMPHIFLFLDHDEVQSMLSDCVLLLLPLDLHWLVWTALFVASKAQRLDDQALSSSDDQQQQTSAGDTANAATGSEPRACELVPSVSARPLGL